MTLGTVVLRVLAFFGLWGTSFWVVGFALSGLLSALLGPASSAGPACAFPVMILCLTGIIIGGCLLAWVRRSPTFLEVAEETEWLDLLRRIGIGGVVTYLGFLGLIEGLGFCLLWASGHLASGDYQEGIAILAWWAPIWICPLGAAVLAWRWSRKDNRGSPQLMP